jgi:hypothetical protein
MRELWSFVAGLEGLLLQGGLMGLFFGWTFAIAELAFCLINIENMESFSHAKASGDIEEHRNASPRWTDSAAGF